MRTTVLRGARTHNLQSVDLDIPAGQVVAITGVSGAGKSSLAMDTLYAEGQRRFVESFSPYARQFLERLARPPMDSLDPIPAAIAVDRRAPVKGSRSTLATMADLEPYLAALFVRESRAICPEHGAQSVQRDPTQWAEHCLEQWPKARIVVCAQQRIDGAEQFLEVRDSLLQAGYRRLWLDGSALDLDEVAPSRVQANAPAQVIIDRLVVSRDSSSRLAAAIEQAWQYGGGLCALHNTQSNATLLARGGPVCPQCVQPLPEPKPGMFSYESPLGACPQCRGFGRTQGIDWNKVIPDPRKTLAKGALRPWSSPAATRERTGLRALCRRQGIPMDVPFEELSAVQQHLLVEGDAQTGGLKGWFAWLEARTYKMHVRVLLSRYRSYDTCSLCNGQRLGDASLQFVCGGLHIGQWHKLEVSQALDRLKKLQCHNAQGRLAADELLSRLNYLQRVGLGYLALDRQGRTLSGGEAQRVTLTAALGTNLHNALFVLDEPSVGLHAHDVQALGTLIDELAQRNNSVVVLEHDAALIRSADRVVELGPGCGPRGGTLSFDGTPAQAAKAKGATARALQRFVSSPPRQLAATGSLGVRGATGHNLQDLDVDLPLGVLCALAGPSGSGKTSLATGIIYRTLARRQGDLDIELPIAHKELLGLENLNKVVLVDQSPLGRTSRGNAATYTKAWDGIRKLFAQQPAAERLGMTPSHFSFNVATGRCEACSGEGFETVEMQFLADVRLLCAHCQGKRFKPEVLSIVHEGKTIFDVLEMTIDEALEFFQSTGSIVKRLSPLVALGLGYLRLGQALSTLSGGEAQRLKLSRSLTEKRQGCLWILDEPSAGLHADEIELVLRACRHLVDGGASVLLVEHDLQLLAAADWIVELGPGAGRCGGTVVANCTPQDLVTLDTKTGRALADQQGDYPSRRPKATNKRPARAVVVQGAREHNLKQVDAVVPHGALTVITGPSGSGKSSLAFDVLFAEGQRRFLETLSPYARQFLPSMPRPDVDQVTGLPPSVSLEQRTARAGAKSTVATVTEISHYLRLLYSKIGSVHCPVHDVEVTQDSPETLLSRLRSTRGRFELCAVAVRARKGTYLDVFNAAARDGITEAYADGVRVATDTPPKLARTKEHTILLVLSKPMALQQLDEALFHRALSWGEGHLALRRRDGSVVEHSLLGSCAQCGFSQAELDPRCFSFNTEQGRCETCSGHGHLLAEQAPKARGRQRAKKKTKKKVSSAASPPAPPPQQCPTCHGDRLSSVPRAVRVQGTRFDDVNRLSVEDSVRHFAALKLTGRAKTVGGDIVSELQRRLQFLHDVGLGYLSLNRAAQSLSGGEMQRLRLSAQLGAGLTGALYVLDEPTIGLHPRDTHRLLGNLRRLVELGSTVVVVEHDEDTVRSADHLIDLGPSGGANGGTVCAHGSVEKVLANRSCPTGQILSAAPALRESLAGTPEQWLQVRGANEHNLQAVDAKFPLGRLTVVAGVSGSGKSTLVRRILLPAVRQKLGLVAEPPGAYDALEGTEPLRRAISVDQSPIGRTPRSVPATFLGIWDSIRKLFASTSDAQVAGFNATRFSFNSASGGRCPDCSGMGAITHEMSFLPDVVQSCPTCRGQRFEPQTLGIRYRGLSIGDVLTMPIEQAVEIFDNHPKIRAPLDTICQLGTGYLTLGQGSHTLSGGEAQRLKLAAELTATARHEPTLYVLDEPTTGLHLSDVARLMRVLDRLVQRGDTLIVVEHHPWVIGGADWVVELGPEGGTGGGRRVAQGRPRQVQKRATATAKVLRELFAQAGSPPLIS